MKATYRKLKTFDEFKECVKLQEEIFGLSDLDKISPLILNLYSKDFPPMGIIIGCFLEIDNTIKMIGFAAANGTLLKNTVYGLAMGILPEYQNKAYGVGLMKKLHEVCAEHNIDYLYGLYEVLESNLGRLYYTMLGFESDRYESECHEFSNEKEASIPADKMLIRWDINSTRVRTKLEKKFSPINLNDLLEKYQIVDEKFYPENDIVLIEIPHSFTSLKLNDPQKASNWRLKTRNAFSSYINDKSYRIIECASGRINGEKKTYYILEKKRND